MPKRDQITDEIFGDIIKTDFNPDIIHLGILDAYDAGAETGVKKGVFYGVGGSVLGIVGLVLYSVYKRRKHESQTVEESA